MSTNIIVLMIKHFAIRKVVCVAHRLAKKQIRSAYKIRDSNGNKYGKLLIDLDIKIDSFTSVLYT